jgi:hypothetical protein
MSRSHPRIRLGAAPGPRDSQTAQIVPPAGRVTAHFTGWKIAMLKLHPGPAAVGSEADFDDAR